MSYMPGMGRAMDDIFEAYAENESLDLPKGEFTAKNCKAFNISLVLCLYWQLLAVCCCSFC